MGIRTTLVSSPVPESVRPVSTIPGGRRPLALRTHPLVFVVVMFLASELMFFAGFFAAYFDLRSLATTWPPAGTQLDVLQSTIGTILLAISSGTMVLVQHDVARLAYARARRWVAVTIVLGIGFLYIAITGWISADFRIDTSAYGSLFFSMTGFHALHVTAGLILLLGLFFGMRRPAFAAENHAGVEAIAYYWHFVFIVWVGLWGTLYLIK